MALKMISSDPISFVMTGICVWNCLLVSWEDLKPDSGGTGFRSYSTWIDPLGARMSFSLLGEQRAESLHPTSEKGYEWGRSYLASLRTEQRSYERGSWHLRVGWPVARHLRARRPVTLRS